MPEYDDNFMCSLVSHPSVYPATFLSRTVGYLLQVIISVVVLVLIRC